MKSKVFKLKKVLTSSVLSMVSVLVDIADEFVRKKKIKRERNGALMSEEEMGHSSGEKPSASCCRQ